jgi:hypothetical protein
MRYGNSASNDLIVTIAGRTWDIADLKALPIGLLHDFQTGNGVAVEYGNARRKGFLSGSINGGLRITREFRSQNVIGRLINHF